VRAIRGARIVRRKEHLRETTSRNETLDTRGRSRRDKRREKKEGERERGGDGGGKSESASGVLRRAPLITNLSRATSSRRRRDCAICEKDRADDEEERIAASIYRYRAAANKHPSHELLEAGMQHAGTHVRTYARTRLARLVCPNRKAKFNHPRAMHRLWYRRPSSETSSSSSKFLSKLSGFSWISISARIRADQRKLETLRSFVRSGADESDV